MKTLTIPPQNSFRFTAGDNLALSLILGRGNIDPRNSICEISIPDRGVGGGRKYHERKFSKKRN